MFDYKAHVFNRSGLAALSDLETPEWKELFEYLEKEQNLFLKNEDQFRSPEYKWPRDPLRTWSRVWEYPYVYYHLKSWKNKKKNKLLRVVDVGSGVTFFPFSVARLGYHVTCIDCDFICKRDLERAIQLVQTNPGIVDFKLTDGVTLPLKDGEADAVYCISVLEHIQCFEKTIKEIARILRPGGLLLLTIDIALHGNVGFGIEEHKRLNVELYEYFDYLFPETTVHPVDMLRSDVGPFPFKFEYHKDLRFALYLVKQFIIKPLMGKRPSPLKFLVVVQGFTMTKR